MSQPLSRKREYRMNLGSENLEGERKICKFIIILPPSLLVDEHKEVILRDSAACESGACVRLLTVSEPHIMCSKLRALESKSAGA